MPTEPKRRRAIVRIALGLAQVVGAVVSVVCLLQTGMSFLTIGAISITAACLAASLILFGKGDREG
jgi:hypothetical protein